MNNKERYRQFCKEEANIPIFSKDWWLDAVCGRDNWDVALVEKNRQITASMPYCIKKIFIFHIITMPHLTQIMGPWLYYPDFKRDYDRIEYEKIFYKRDGLLELMFFTFYNFYN